MDGLTTIQIREKLEDLYSKYYKEPKILVTVTGYNSKHIFIYGESGRQGWVPYRGHQTFSDVIGEVGGVTERAAYWRCKVIRGDPDNPEITSVNFRKIMLEGDLRQDVSLAEGDVIRVPPTWLAWIGYQIGDLLFPFRSILSAAGTVGAIEVHRDELHRKSRLRPPATVRLLAAGRLRSLEPRKLCTLNISG